MSPDQCRTFALVFVALSHPVPHVEAARVVWRAMLKADPGLEPASLGCDDALLLLGLCAYSSKDRLRLVYGIEGEDRQA